MKYIVYRIDITRVVEIFYPTTRLRNPYPNMQMTLLRSALIIISAFASILIPCTTDRFVVSGSHISGIPNRSSNSQSSSGRVV